jgi:hypothetical protein
MIELISNQSFFVSAQNHSRCGPDPGVGDPLWGLRHQALWHRAALLLLCPVDPSRKESDGKWAGKSNKKIGNAHLKWAIWTAAMTSLRESDQAKKYVDRLSRKHNKGKALGIYTHKQGRAVYFMLKNKRAFDMKHFFSH